MPVTFQKLRDFVIERAIISVNKHETRECRRQGCLEGLELCRSLLQPKDYLGTLKERQLKEAQMALEKTEKEVYWRYRCATAQVEFVWERLKVGYVLQGFLPENTPLSARAGMDVAALVGVKGSKIPPMIPDLN